MRELKTALYVGKGASHSWIWLVDTLDRAGLRNIQFVTDIKGVKADILVVSGGDPFAIFSGVRREGVTQIRRFIEEGGTYLGICAGSYFALKFHENPYPWLNLVESEISNFSVNPPPNRRMPHKYTVPYRDGFVFHPVREDVILTCGENLLTAPLYGGPGIRSADAESWAVYTKFTDKTVFLCDEDKAEDVLLGTSALLSKNVLRGRLLLFGPHLEHPSYPEANKELVKMFLQVPPKGYTSEVSGKPVSGTEKRKWTRELKRWVSNGRLAAFNLETYHWKIGEKIYDPERLAYFLETCFKLIKILEQKERVYVTPELPGKAQELASKVRKLGPDPGEAEVILEGLKTFTACLYSLYFSTLRTLQPPPVHIQLQHQHQQTREP